MKTIRMKFAFVCVFVAILSQAFSLPIRPINGPDAVTPGSTSGYYYNASSVLSSPSWEVTGGTISYTNVDGETQYSVTILWGSAGTGTIVLKNGTTTLSTKSVDITSAAGAFLSGGGTYCTGQSANISVFSSVSGHSYQLYRDGTATQPAKTGNGGVLTWSVTLDGTYTCVTPSGGTVAGSAQVVMDPGPTVFNVISASYSYCEGTRTITLDDSDAPSVGSSYFLRQNGTIVGSSVGGTGHDISWTNISGIGTYTVTAQSGDGCPSTMTGSVAINPIPSAPPSITGTDRCGPGSITLTGTAGSNGNLLKWYTTDIGGTSEVTALSYVPSPLVTTTYYASTFNSSTGCESGTRTPAIATIKPVPNVGTTNQRDICSGETIQISISDLNGTPGTSFIWTYNGNQITGGNSGSGSTINQTLTRTGVLAVTTASYTIIATGSNGCVGPQFVASVNVKRSEIDCVNMNYVVSHTILDDNVINAGDVEFLPDTSVNQAIQYFDGLGHSIQNVIKHGSPTNGDVVQPVSYDPYGREQYKYLPYIDGVNGRFKDTFIAKEKSNYAATANPQFNFYQEGTAIPTDSVPYSTIVFEMSPLNRPVAEYGPGQGWHSADKKVTYSYPLNVHGTGNSGSQETIIVWKVDPSTSSLARDNSLAGGYYPTGSLTIKSTKDEQGNEVREYANKSGQVILKKVYVTGSTTDFNTLGNWAETYYVYDDLGNLAFVLPPEATKRIIQSN